MAELSGSTTSGERMNILSILLLSPDADAQLSSMATFRNIDQQQFDAFLELANSNHVIVRGMKVYSQIMRAAQDETRTAWATTAVARENARIVKAIEFLRVLCDAFDSEGIDVTVMKSLDHWPDFGSDIDLYTNTPSSTVCSFMQRQFGAQIAARSWGDRLACKWNFNIPDLPDPVEIHMGRLGQTGEQLVLAATLPGRARLANIESQSFRVPSASDRIMISTLQRMYRHFYFRLCDIVDSAMLARSGDLDYEELRFSAQKAGIWEGVATYLVIVSDYIDRYSGTDLVLPQFVKDSARFDGKMVFVKGDFLRVPIVPQSVGLYRSQVGGLIRRRELQSSARLGLLPWLATAAAIGYKIAGSDKGIW